ncbi:MAG TPA: SBBP repeat-containing protein [Bacteroidales bacterium]|nr:SBBP repeat-containing protein [Bacteroidales bacterium]
MKTALFFSFLIITINHVSAQKLSLEYSTFLGGSSDDRAHVMAIDKRGNIYLTAPIVSTDFPITANALNNTPSGIYLAKISAGGDSLIFSTYIGASGGANYAHGVFVDDKGYIYITGNTTNSDFPTTEKAFDRTFNGPADASHGDAFVMKLNPEGNEIIYSTFIGGSGMDISGKITVDAEGNAYVIGSTSSADFPVSNGAYDTTFNGGSNDGRDDIFVLKLNAKGSDLLYCTYIGGSNTELYGNNILIDNTGTVYFAATTSSSNFPVTANAFDKTYNGGSGIRGAGDGVIVILNPEGTSLEYSTFFGGSGDDFAYGLSRNEKNDNIYICGGTSSSDIPLTPDAFAQNTKSGYFAEFSNDATKLLYSTYWNASIQTIGVQKSGNIIISGSTESTDLTVTTKALDTAANGSGDIYISIFNPVNNTLLYSTYFGGKNNDILSSLLIDGKSLFICGNTASPDFPVSEKAYDKSFNGGTNQWGGDAYVSRFIFDL